MTILREHTNQKHREVEATPFVQYLLSGNITKEHYASFLYEFRTIYEVIERENTKHDLLKGLEGIERAEAINDDLYELSQSYFHSLMPSTIEYTNHILQLSKTKSKRNLLFAHVYVRHTGDLYGGKIIARLVPGSGRMYAFDDRPGLIKKINEKLTEDLADEANLAFDYFIKIFNELTEYTKHANV
jgi:heme oxygenase